MLIVITVAYIIEDRGFRIVCLENPTNSILFACTAERCVSPVEPYARFSWNLFARRFHVLFLPLRFEKRTGGRGVDETWYFVVRQFAVETRTRKHVFFRLIVYLSKCINNQ